VQADAQASWTYGFEDGRSVGQTLVYATEIAAVRCRLGHAP
jgi:hypothetical protein